MSIRTSLIFAAAVGGVLGAGALPTIGRSRAVFQPPVTQTVLNPFTLTSVPVAQEPVVSYTAAPAASPFSVAAAPRPRRSPYARPRRGGF